jgi:hypothetical protein
MMPYVDLHKNAVALVDDSDRATIQKLNALNYSDRANLIEKLGNGRENVRGLLVSIILWLTPEKPYADFGGQIDVGPIEKLREHGYVSVLSSPDCRTHFVVPTKKLFEKIKTLVDPCQESFATRSVEISPTRSRIARKFIRQKIATLTHLTH